MKKFLSLCLALALTCGLMGCSKADKPDETSAAGDQASKSLVGVSMPTKDLQRWNQDGSNMKAKLEEAGYEVDLQYASNATETQLTQIENMISNGCKVLVIASIDGSSLGTVMEQAKEAGVPVIAYDRLIMNSDAVKYYATFDNFDVGVKQGQYVEEKLDLKNAGDKTYNIEFITGDPGDNNINFFYDGSMSVLQPYVDSGVLKCPSGQIAKAEVATPGWATEAAQSRFDTILASYYADGTNLDAVLAANDSTALGVANALAAGYTGTYPIISGQDCDVANVKNLIAGTQAMSVFKDTRDLADKTCEMVDAIMKGGEPTVNDTTTYDNGTGIIPSYLCTPKVCTIDNYKEVLIDSGYYQESELTK